MTSLGMEPALGYKTRPARYFFFFFNTLKNLVTYLQHPPAVVFFVPNLFSVPDCVTLKKAKIHSPAPHPELFSKLGIQKLRICTKFGKKVLWVYFKIGFQ